MKSSYSIYALIACFAVILYCGHVFYPKYKYLDTEATISWDVSGYYFYLPAIFIYKDVKKLGFKDDILKKYTPTPNFQQGYLHKNGNYVLKYSIGQSIQYLPWFGLAHIWATNSSQYDADGFSRPYQVMISWGMLLIAFLGLFVLRKILLRFASDKATAATLISLVWGTNYLDYSAINGAMTHNSLFTIYICLIYATIRFYEKPKYSWAIIIGGLVGLAALTRPTEIIASIIPIFWGLKGFGHDNIKNHLSFFKKHLPFYFLAICICGSIGMIQLFYWKWVGGEWIIYSYEDQGFDWLHPHLYEGIFSYASGWLIYSPILIFALMGYWQLFRNKVQGRFAILFFSLIFIYLCFAWSIWDYGGALGQRAMIQSYAVLAIPMALFYEKVFHSKFWTGLITSIFVLFCCYNLWLTQQAHKGGLLRPGQMTKAYYWKILGRQEVDISAQKLLDTDEEFLGKRKDVSVLLTDDFEAIGDSICLGMTAIDGIRSLCLSPDRRKSNRYLVDVKANGQWIRAQADFRIGQKEWDRWSMVVLFVRALNTEGGLIKERYIRVHRLLHDNETRKIHLDFSIPNLTDEIEVWIRNSKSMLPTLVDNLVIEEYYSTDE